MYKIEIGQSDTVFTYESGKNLLEVLLDKKIFVDNPCNGKGVCGKCKVRIVDGEAGKVTETEKKLLNLEELRAGVRLSCLIQPESDLKIELLQKERKHEVLTSGYIPDFKRNPDIFKQIIEIRRPSLDDQTTFEEQIKEQIPGIEIPFGILSASHFNTGAYTAVLCKKKSEEIKLIGLEVGDTTDIMYGVAIDIGTTTVVTALIDMLTGEEAAMASMINAQKHFGLDVLTRITYEMEHPHRGTEELQKAIVDSINDMILNMCSQKNINREQIYEITIGANCTMMHMLLGIDAVSIGRAPYAPMFVKTKDILAAEIGIRASKGARLYCLPSVSAYIGADIVAGAYVCGLHKTKENVLFIDIGTNGEIVLSKRGKLLCCSCAAGPALEGMNISSGMRAAEGAVEDVKITEQGVSLKVIGGGTPIGVCGSGILSVVEELIRTGLIKKDGAFIKLNKLEKTDYRCTMLRLDGKKRKFIMAEGPEKLYVTQGDVRQVQLAKGAILSGFYALLNKAGMNMQGLDKVMIAGQFGAHLPAESLTGTGILPSGIEDKLVYVGNSSKTGAYMALMSGNVKEEMEDIGSRMEYMELGATEGYERLFADCLMFPEV